MTKLTMLEADSLNALWQSQPTQYIDIDKIKTQYRSQTMKQRLYLVLDILSFLPVIILYFAFSEQMTFTIKAFIFVTTLAALVFTFYITWLRRLGLTGQLAQTSNFIKTLANHLDNCRRIAKTTWLSFIVLFIGMSIMFTIHFSVNPDNFHIKKGITILVMGVFSFVGMVWAKKRETRFTRERDSVQAMMDE